MSRYARPIAWIGLLVLILPLFIVAQLPTGARAAPDPAYTVTTTLDLLGNACGADASAPTDCSLRQALNAAIAAGGNVTVSFDIDYADPGYDPLTQTWTIALSSALPLINKPSITIDGNSQAVARGVQILGPVVFIDGTAVDNRGGLTLVGADNSTIWRLGLINFQGNPSVTGDLAGVGIEISNSTNVTVIGCSIGVGQDGLTPAGNDAAGILIQGGTGNTIGGNNNLTDKFNIISGNQTDGILIRYSNNNIIVGNRIGTGRSGQSAIPNNDNGIQLVLGADGNQIGPPDDQSASDSTLRNIIAGNGGYGVKINEAINTKINGNWIGNFYSASKRVANGKGGVQILSTVSGPATGNTIGGNTSTARNVIGGNNGPGVAITGPLSNDNTIANNFIGLALNGTNVLSNTAGIVLSGGGDRNTIGGNGTLARNNVIGFNTGGGISVSGTSGNITSDTIISGNYVGVTAGGVQQANLGAGITIGSYVQKTTIGGATADGRNVIARNTGDGITIGGTNVLTTTIGQNTISFNGGNGVAISGANVTTIDGGAAETPVQISDNGAGSGIAITGGVTTTVSFASLARNREGLKAGGNARGISLSNSSVTFNTGGGVIVSGGSKDALSNNTIQENSGDGVRIGGGAQDVTISANKVFSNTVSGVTVADTNTKHVSIRGNQISGNAVPVGGSYSVAQNGNGKGIVLTPQGPTESTSNPNNDINRPSNLKLRRDGRLTGRVILDTGPGNCPGCQIELYAANPKTRDGQGLTPIAANVEIGTTGYFTATLPSVPAQIALTATDKDGNTSEFAVLTADYGLRIAPPRSTTAVPGETITYVHTVTNTGTIGLDDIRLDRFLQHPAWTAVVTPSVPFELDAGASRTVTMTLTLPLGADPSVRYPTIEQTRVTVSSTAVPTATASVTDTTSVGQKFLLKIDPPKSEQVALPTETAFFAHTLRNDGNVTATLSLEYATDLPGWTTIVTPSAPIVLGPGKEKAVTMSVRVPLGTSAGTKATSYITVTNAIEGGGTDLSQVQVITDTTVADTKRDASIIPESNAPADAATLQKVPFSHEVVSNSNGPVKYKLTGFSSLGSSVRFIGAGGVTFNPTDNTFTLDGEQPALQRLNFIVEVTVAADAQVGDQDFVTIILTDVNTGRDIDAAFDTINVIRKTLPPRIWIPIVSSPQ